MAGSEASEALQRAWVAVIMAIQDALGSVKDGNCFLINMTAGPMAEHVLLQVVSVLGNGHVNGDVDRALALVGELLEVHDGARLKEVIPALAGDARRRSTKSGAAL